METKTCCPKCHLPNYAYPPGPVEGYCENSSCECHEEPTRIHGSSLHSAPTDSEVEGWEKEFDRLWAKHFADLKEKRRFPTRARFKDFIRFLLSSYGKEQYERGYEEGQDNTIEADGLARDSLWFEKGKEAAEKEFVLAYKEIG